MNLPAVNAAASSMVLPKRLYPSAGQPTVMLLMALGMLAGGVWMLLYGKPDLEAYGWAGFLMLVGVVIGVVSIMLLVPGMVYIELTSRGLTFKGFRRSSTWSWGDLQEFGVFRMGRTTMVGIRYVEGYTPSGAFTQRLLDYNKSRTGYDGGIGPYRFGMSHQELADLLNGLKKRYGGGGFK